VATVVGQDLCYGREHALRHLLEMPPLGTLTIQSTLGITPTWE
jgi:hypothetical protein